MMAVMGMKRPGMSFQAGDELCIRQAVVLLTCCEFACEQLYKRLIVMQLALLGYHPHPLSVQRRYKEKATLIVGASAP
jgi:hypothetical protein